MNIEARLIDGPRGGELFAIRDLVPTLRFARLRPLNSRDFIEAGRLVEPDAIEHINYEIDHVIAFYRVAR